MGEAQVQELDDQLIDGTWLDDDDRGIVIGAGMAKTLGVDVGDKLVYMGQHGDATEMVSRLFRVKGIFQTGGPELDGFVAMANLSAAQELLGADRAHMVTLHLTDPDQSVAATEAMTTALGARNDVEVLHWMKAIPELYGLIQIDRASGDFGLVLLGLIVAMGVLNTVLMSALERTREFGVMLAVGMRPRQLTQLILFEGLVLGIIGSLLGLGLGIAAGYPVVTQGIDFAALYGIESMETGGVQLDLHMYGAYNPLRMINYTVGALVFTTLAALYPALHVASFKPVDAMRHA